MPKNNDTAESRGANKRKWLILAIILVIAAGIYLNRAYSHIYGVIGDANLRAVDGQETYIINDMATSTLKKAASRLVYSALGDSLTAGAGVASRPEMLPYLLAEKFSGGDKTVILKNHSFPGIETSDIITSFLPAALADNPDIITLLIGVNDIHNKVSAAEFAANYEEIIKSLKQGTKAKIYIINIPFIGSDKLMLPPYQSLFDARTREFNKIIKSLTDKYSVKYIDLYSPTVDLFKRSGDHYSQDLFHPSASGYKLWADIIYDNINN